jgi:hypothetical protein
MISERREGDAVVALVFAAAMIGGVVYRVTDSLLLGLAIFFATAIITFVLFAATNGHR